VLTKEAKGTRWIISIVLLFYTTCTIFVLVATVLGSFKTKSDLISNFTGWPKEFSLANYQTILFKDNFGRYFLNTTILTLCGTAGCIFLSAMAAYGIARYSFRGKSFLTSYFLIGLMVPIQVSVLPLFIILRSFGLLNHLLGMILVYASGISMSCLIFQKFFATVPKELEESAHMDGCNDFRIFVEIILPISKPILSTMALISAIGNWNDFYMPMVLLGTKNVRTLTLTIYYYIKQFTKYMGESMAAVVVTLIPILLLYFLFSSQIVEGLTSGAVKG
jgi:raffinose/stachyose/melibiose transport system permease protein